jgi:hypothetical protein
MAKPRVSTLVPKGGLPPAAVVERFITFFVNERDAKLAACKASLMPEMGAKLYKHPRIRARIDHKILLIDVEEAKLRAKSKRLTVERLDAALVEEVDSKKNGHIRVRAIELGYRRTGLIRDGEFYVAPDPSANKNAPSIYQARQTKVTATVTKEVTDIFAVREY